MTTTGFVLDLATLAPGVCRLELRSPPADLDLPAAQWPAEVSAVVEVERTGELVAVRGLIRAAARLECVRCLRAFDRTIEADLAVYADRAGGAHRLEEDLERDDYMRFHDGRRLDLREEAREALLLEIPMTPRCREACPGLCPRCGADLNLGPCACAG